MIRVTAFRSLPEMVRGYVRDIGVRWALEELELPYEMNLIEMKVLGTEGFRELQPFGQIPVYEEKDLMLFESGAIVLHIAEKSSLLMPSEMTRSARVKAWMFAAMNTMDPIVKQFEEIAYFEPEADWAKLRRGAVEQKLSLRLKELSKALEGRKYLEGEFSAADILMTMVLRIVADAEVFKAIPSLVLYVKRCESREAFQKAYSKHMASFD